MKPHILRMIISRINGKQKQLPNAGYVPINMDNLTSKKVKKMEA